VGSRETVIPIIPRFEIVVLRLWSPIRSASKRVSRPPSARNFKTLRHLSGGVPAVSDVGWRKFLWFEYRRHACLLTPHEKPWPDSWGIFAIGGVTCGRPCDCSAVRRDHWWMCDATQP
jgi:hypothetical protein